MSKLIQSQQETSKAFQAIAKHSRKRRVDHDKDRLAPDSDEEVDSFDWAAWLRSASIPAGDASATNIGIDTASSSGCGDMPAMGAVGTEAETAPRRGFFADQFENLANHRAHRDGTGRPHS